MNLTANQAIALTVLFTTAITVAGYYFLPTFDNLKKQLGFNDEKVESETQTNSDSEIYCLSVVSEGESDGSSIVSEGETVFSYNGDETDNDLDHIMF